MAQFCKVDMLAPGNRAVADLILITGNSTLRSDGELVMGLGGALRAKNLYPQLPAVLGAAIRSRTVISTPFNHGNYIYYECSPPYKLLISPHWPSSKLGLFQTKTRFYLPSTLNLIEEATIELMLWCLEHPGRKVFLNFPGVGCGQLNPDQVRPIVSRLPDDVTIWTLS